MMDRDFKNEAEMPKVGNPNQEIEEWQKIDFCVFGTNFNFNFLINFQIKNEF